MPTEFIVKIQKPIASNHPEAIWLIYNQDRSVHALLAERDVPRTLKRDMRSSHKAFYYAVAAPHQPGDLEIKRKAPWQEW